MKLLKKLPVDPWLVGWAIMLVLVFIGSVIPSDNPARGIDKYVHFVVYFLLTVIPLTRIRRRDIAIITAAFIPVFGLLIEYVQRSISSREFSPEDMIANNTGALIGFIVGILIRIGLRLRRVKK